MKFLIILSNTLLLLKGIQEDMESIYTSTVISPASHLQGEEDKSWHDNTEETSPGAFMTKMQSSSFWNIVERFYAEFKYLQNHNFNIDNVFCKFF